MAKVDIEFQKLCNKIFAEGREYENKSRGVKRLQIPSFTFRHNTLVDGFPALTGKKLYFKGVVAELLWFLRGQTNIWYLHRDKVNIWDKDAYNSYKQVASTNEPINNNLYMAIDSMGNRHYPHNVKGVASSYSMFTFEEFITVMHSIDGDACLGLEYSTPTYTLGDVGQNYSAQWRRFNGNVDQISILIRDMKKDIMGSRLKVNAWNPSELDKTALPPCHDGFQIIGVPLTREERIKYAREVLGINLSLSMSLEELNKTDVPEFGFELHWNQRSVDTFLGLPFNITSYAVLGELLAKITGYPLVGIEGALKCVHFYDNQYDEARAMMERDIDIYKNCSISIAMPNEFPATIDYTLNGLSVDSFKLVGYESYKAVKVDMLAPKEI